MSESIPVIFNITAAGRLAALNQEQNGLNLNLNKIGFGNGHYASVDNDQRVNLQNKLVEAQLSAGGIIGVTNTLILAVNFVPPTAVQVSEIGIFTEDGTLFAVASLAAGQFFTLDVGISFVASFGLALGTTSNITVSVQTDVPIMQQLMIQHETAENPHPQYALKTDVKQKDDHLQEQIDKVIEDIGLMYPRLIASGVTIGSATVDLTGKVDDLRDTKYVLTITPEGGHEGWTITRALKSFTYSVFDRSGTNRVGYGGRVNWSVIQASPDSQIVGDGEYTLPGDYVIGIAANTTKEIIIVGAGGSGGGFRWSTDYSGNANGTDGTDTTLSLDGVTFAIASGGKHGTQGVWGNGSSFENGVGGAGGQVITQALANVTLVESLAGNKGKDSRENHHGGATVSPILAYGAGGDGGDGGGDEGWSFGGGGGSGAYIKVKYQNTTNEPIYIGLTIGAAGVKSKNYNGEDGVNGYAKVSSIA
ncbi:phage tail protein [Acinetobacter nosocomialis]|uniref:phage tail-collar fiber domain-containing protein n=1 Tax=Acinetobacter nosocomialis TaxID=106654 RepID=UPI00244CA412|nr:phage tail protein [Acinetobacter nosocomialis]MDH2636793.1 phage tail protein [Acinetobacter nosocomialis]